MTVIDVFAERKKESIMLDTWGHLAPIPGYKYHGYVLFTINCYQEFSIHDWKFEGLEDSPWQAEHFAELLDLFSDTCHEVGVYKYTGWYKPFKNGSCQFKSAPFVKLKIVEEQ